ncbi:hypothetical protein P43SY_003227 [Pythium insidiosum]|uniref:RNA polymerase II subunit A C-terminal domain phosphatase n=1 Tax=Pythium insidiosum TaxID=114742 RepID=A0AAD5M6Z7_PYTIN|nr:hypothetical protein P43SY_003227 [Pythium insidiosum]
MEELCMAALAASAAWTVADGAVVDKGQVVGTAGQLELGTQQQLVAPCHGTLRICSPPATSGDDGAADTADVAFVEYCIHPLLNGRTCMMCLAVVDENEDELDDERRSVNVISHGQVLRLNVEEAKKFDSATMTRQLQAKKLSLVLDLDHTLLHAVRVSDVVGEIAKTDDTHFFFIPGLPHQEHVVKLRPGLATFLKELSTLYDLFIYTHGTRLYAEEIAKIIDPTGAIFQHRIVARTDTPEMAHKSLKLLFPSCDDRMILVLDDRIDVWKENEGNVFLIEPYHHFKCTAEINNASGQSVLGAGTDDDSNASTDRHLAHATRVLQHVHGAFYGTREISADDQLAGRGNDVKQLLLEHKKTVLAGCRIVFSGLWEQGVRRPETRYLWRLAVELGATTSMQMQGFDLTHLVIHPARLETQKHIQARATPGVFVVTPEWMLKSARIWERADETEFLADALKAKLAAQRAARDAAPAATSRPEEAKTDASGEPPAVAPPKPLPDSILVREPKPGEDKKAKKSVKFSEEVDAAEAAKRNADTARGASDGGPKALPRGPTARPRVGPSRMRSAAIHVPAENKGVVASGGTFDFLAKIKQMGSAKREHKPVASTLQQAVVARVKASPPSKPTSAAAPEKDIDDAFLRLIEAEEEEDAQELKRKQSSDSLKDQLASRRLKRQRREAAASAARVGQPDAHAPATATDDGDDDGDDGDGPEDDVRRAAVLRWWTLTVGLTLSVCLTQLDDLEADILDAL